MIKLVVPLLLLVVQVGCDLGHALALPFFWKRHFREALRGSFLEEERGNESLISENASNLLERSTANSVSSNRTKCVKNL